VNQLLRYLRAISPASVSAEVSDRELLTRFARRKDSEAFAMLVSRHGAAVWAACRRLLDCEPDAEDAFQAVFITLARKASAVSGDCLAAWLHAVARRIAANVRREQQRRTATEDAARVPEGRTADVSWREGLVILDEELARLPDRYRAVLIACCLNGQSRDEAARQLGCSEGRVKGLLERGRELLRQRLSLRGFELGAILLAATVAQTVSAMPAVSGEVAVRIAQGQSVAGIVSATAIAHSERVVGVMFAHKVKALAAILLGTAVAVGGAYTHNAAGTEPGKKGDREPGHAFAPRGGMAVTDDPLKGPSKPLPPQRPGSNPFALVPPNRGGADVEIPLQKVYTEDKLDPKMLRIPGNRFAMEVFGRTDGECWGTELYFYESDLGTAAVHAGLVKVGERAVITVTVVKCPKSAEGNRQNGVTSLPWDDAATTDTALLLQRIAGKDKPAVKEPAGLTIDEAILAKPDQKVKVLFEVGSVEWEDLVANDPKGESLKGQEWRLITFHSKHKLKDGRKFVVFMSGVAVTPIFRLGLMKGKEYPGTDYFRGKTIRVTGQVEALEELINGGVAYRIIVTNLDDLEVMKY
jgi:RNA polymerase sigma factor (sigma-70 family)